MSSTRPLLSLGIDLDNLWAYMKIHGDPGWESHPTYLDLLAKIMLEVMRRHGLRVTLFVVGQDAALQKNAAALAALAAAGHEIGNHSFGHEPWLHRYSRSDIEDDLARAADAIERATGRRPIGFRGPGYSLSPDTLRVLVARGYLYDCSTLPTWLGPLARAYYFWKCRGMAVEERDKRRKLFGSFRDGFQPIRPYAWSVDDSRLVEIPVTTMPLARVPFHMSYLLYLMRFSRAAALAHLRTALALCRAGGVTPSFLLHPLDFLGCDRVRELAFFPGMDLPTAAKVEFVERALEIITASFQVVTLEEHARAVIAAPEAEVRRLRREEALG
jgi:peptidoglycan/xylan/chitin deacetylase (PgdA/CDA1 family)